MSEPPAEAMPTAAAPPGAPRPDRRLATALAAAVLVLIAAIAAAPFWAPPLLPLLPWGAAATRPDPALLQRIERLETASGQAQQAAAQQIVTLDQLARRVAAVEAKQAEQQPAAAKSAAAVQQLESRIAALEARQKQDQQTVASAASSLNQLEARLAKLEAMPQASAKDVGELRQHMDKLSATEADLSTRIEAVEKAARPPAAVEPVDTALLLVLLQIRDAVQTARPFAAEYRMLTGLARDRHEIGEAVAPLAEAASNGVASRAVLAQRLHELAGSITNAEARPTEPDWGSEALARLRGLVTIRRIGGAGQSGPEAAVGAAETALAAGDLPGAIGALDKLGGAAAEAARPWLQMARQRQTVEEALRRIEALLVARLGKPADPAAAPSPG